MGLWTKCHHESTGHSTCDDYDTFFLGLPASLQVKSVFVLHLALGVQVQPVNQVLFIKVVLCCTGPNSIARGSWQSGTVFSLNFPAKHR